MRERRDLAERIRALRLARGLTQAGLAGEDFTKGYISQLETGRVGLSLRAAQSFAQRLGVPVADLLHAPDSGLRAQQVALLEAERELVDGSPARALELAGKLGRSGPLRGRVLRLQGRSLVALDRAAEAVPVLERALEAFRVASDQESHIRAQYDFAYAHARLDHPQQALVLLLQCEQALRGGQLVDRTFELEVEAFLASVYARLGDADAAAPHLERAQAIALDVVDHDALAATYGRLASTEQQQGRYERALDLWRRCLRELEVAGRERLVGDTWHNVATTYLLLGQHDRARDALTRAGRYRDETGHARLGTWIKVTGAKLAMHERRLGEAERLAREAAGDAAATALARAEARLVMGQILVRRHAPLARIKEAFEAALSEMRSEPVGTRVRALKLYADALATTGEVATAFKVAREALELARPGR